MFKNCFVYIIYLNPHKFFSCYYSHQQLLKIFFKSLTEASWWWVCGKPDSKQPFHFNVPHIGVLQKFTLKKDSTILFYNKKLAVIDWETFCLVSVI